MSNSFTVSQLPSADAVADYVADRLFDQLGVARPAGSPYTIALSGGRVAAKFFTAVAARNQVRQISFENVHFFWADERCVPPTDAESNFKLADELLLAPLKIPASQVHRLRGEDEPAAAAQHASTELLNLVPPGPAGQPVLDLVILGLGEDGHVASLFPNAGPEVVNCTTPFLAIHDSPKPPPLRISLSYPAITAARQIWVLAPGAAKEQALKDSISSPVKTSLGRVLAVSACVDIYTDLKIPGNSPAAAA